MTKIEHKRTPNLARIPGSHSADVYRTRDGWLVKFDLAGVADQDVTVTYSRPAPVNQRRPARLVPGGRLQSLLHGDLVQPL